MACHSPPHTCDRVVSLPTRAARMSSMPLPFTVPADTLQHQHPCRWVVKNMVEASACAAALSCRWKSGRGTRLLSTLLWAGNINSAHR